MENIIDINEVTKPVEMSESNQEKLNKILEALLTQLSNSLNTSLETKELLEIAKAMSDLQKAFFVKPSNVEINNNISEAGFNFFKNLKNEI